MLAFLLVPDRRGRLVSVVRPLAAAYGLAAVVAAPLLYYALTNLRKAGLRPPGSTTSPTC